MADRTFQRFTSNRSFGLIQGDLERAGKGQGMASNADPRQTS